MGRPKGRAAIFLDRDNTLTEDVPYCASPDDLHLIEGVGEAVHKLNELGFLTIVITNQSGIARGFFTLEQLGEVHAELRRQMGASGARIDAIYFCPHLPTDGCACRKPGTLLFERACADLGVDPKRSFVIGDRGADIEAGFWIGCRTVLIHNDVGSSELARLGIAPTVSCPGLPEFVRWLVVQGRDVLADANGTPDDRSAGRASDLFEVDANG